MVIFLNALQAILSVPGALHAIRSLSSDDPNTQSKIIENIVSIEHSLKTFSLSGKWFIEAKEYHERLTLLDHGMRELVETVNLPRSEGALNPDRFDISRLVSNWKKTRNSFFRPILVFLQHQSAFDEQPLDFDELGAARGPKHAVRFAELQTKIDKSIAQYDPRGIERKQELCDLIDEIEDHVKDEILRADKQIIERATEIAHCLTQLRDLVAHNGQE